MEGVVDHLMRDMLSQIGGYDMCVTEFVRVVDALLPERVFYRLCPELHSDGLTPAGVPVKVQLLGQDPQCLAENAARAVELGSRGIDLNFGCPAKTVNKSKGGAVLLKEPERLYAIAHAVRQAVPKSVSVTAKMRLGFEDKSLAIANAQAFEAADVSEIAIHARTKVEGYNPPAYWPWIAKMKRAVKTPLVANGEIWTPQDARLCQQQSECDNIMLGRGALATPNLAHAIKTDGVAMSWSEVSKLLVDYSGYEIYGDKGIYYPNRIKQWFRYLMIQYPEAKQVFQIIRVLRDPDAIVEQLRLSSAKAQDSLLS